MSEDPRVKEGICGVTHIGASGTEWICVRKPHAAVYTRKVSSRTHRKGDLKFSDNPQADRHYFVIRWPYRNKE